jgi:transcriptional regulator with XRE-family HTH domain
MILPVFVRVLRESLGISQGEIAKQVDKSQSAIAQYESMKATLSKETLVTISKILKINPEFIETGLGNPFKLEESDKLLKLFINETQYGEPDFLVIQTIAENNHDALFIFFYKMLAPFLHKRSQKSPESQNQYNSIITILVQDQDNNTFLFKRKDNKVFDAIGLKEAIGQIILKENKNFSIITKPLSGVKILRDLSHWDKINKETIKSLIGPGKNMENRRLLSMLVSGIWNHETMLTEKDVYERVLGELGRLAPDELNSLLDRLIPEIADTIEKSILRNP